jgi:hypothetical protein
MNFTKCTLPNCGKRNHEALYSTYSTSDAERIFTCDTDYCFCSECFKLFIENNSFPEGKEIFIQMNHNGEEVAVPCGLCSEKKLRKFLAISKLPSGICSECCENNLDSLYNENSLLIDPFSPFIRLSEEIFKDELKKARVDENILNKLKIRLIYCSNKDNMIKKTTDSYRKFTLALLYDYGHRSITLAMAYFQLTDSYYKTDIFPNNKGILTLSYFDAVSVPELFESEERVVVLGLFILSIVIASIQLLSIQLFYFHAVTPNIYSDWLLWCAMVSRAKGGQLDEDEEKRQAGLLKFYVKYLVEKLISNNFARERIDMFTFMIR